MAKKIFISIIAFFYLAVASGIVVNFHYCMGKISSVTFNHEKDHNDGNCSKCGMEKTENHCCSDETAYLKITDSHQSPAFAADVSAGSIAIPAFEVDLTCCIQGLTKFPSTDYFSPPPKTLNKVYLANNVFRI